MCIVGLRAARFTPQYFVLLAFGSTRILNQPTEKIMEFSLGMTVGAILFGAWIIRDSIITLAKVIEQGNEIRAREKP